MGFWNWLAKKVAARIEIAPPPPPAQPRIDLNLALENLIGKGLIERTTADLEFFKVMADIKTKSVMQALGSKGGNERVRRMRERQRASPTYCPVCPPRNDGLTTRLILKWHMQGHQGPRPTLPQGSRAGEQPTKAADANRRTTELVRSPQSAATDDEAKNGS